MGKIYQSFPTVVDFYRTKNNANYEVNITFDYNEQPLCRVCWSQKWGN
jgi:hypothetical protein